MPSSAPAKGSRWSSSGNCECGWKFHHIEKGKRGKVVCVCARMVFTNLLGLGLCVVREAVLRIWRGHYGTCDARWDISS